MRISLCRRNDHSFSLRRKDLFKNYDNEVYVGSSHSWQQQQYSYNQGSIQAQPRLQQKNIF